MERVRRREPETYRRPEGELDLNTTAKMAYTRKPMEKTTPIKPQETHLTPGKFEGTTTMHVSNLRPYYSVKKFSEPTFIRSLGLPAMVADAWVGRSVVSVMCLCVSAL